MHQRVVTEESFVVAVTSGHNLERPSGIMSHDQVATLPFVKAGTSNLVSYVQGQSQGKRTSGKTST
jgi:hypothetical protein